jgi:hypothetical protein
MFGGPADAHPEAKIWKYADLKVKRPVKISVKKWYGDAHHWYVMIEEDDDELWVPPSKDHPEGMWWRPSSWYRRGQKFDQRFKSEKAAHRFVDLVVKDFFSSKSHEFLKVTGLAETSRYTFREGD